MRVSSRFLIAVLLLWCTRSMAQAPALPGQWNWGAGGGITEIRADGTGRDARGNTMQWALSDASARVYVLRWSHGYTDTVTLAADGASLSGANQHGFRFSATRIGGGAVPTPVSAGGGGAIAGEWTWGVGGGIVEIRPDGTGRDGRGNSMQWTLRDPASRRYELRWSHGYTDTATLAADGNTLTVVNNKGTRFSATRRGESVTSRPLDLNGSWSGGLVHVWQEGAEVLITATWKRADGKYVSLRGEGRLSGSVVDLRIRYSSMTHGPVPEWRGRMTVSGDGNTLDAVYSVNGEERDKRVYSRDR